MRPAALLVAASLVALSNAARAEEEKQKAEQETEKEKAETEEAKGALDFEVVIGAGQVDALNPIPNSTVVSGQLRYERALTDSVAAGFVLSGRWDVSKNFNLGLRFPVALASLRPQGDIARTSVNLGNVEVEAEYERELGEHAEVFLGFHVALPTSLGNELPSEATLAGNQTGIDPVAADKFAINQAVSHAFGNENTALWLAGYLGFVPAAGVKLRFGPVRIEPYVKAENMISVRPESQERAIVELDAGGRFAVEVASFPKEAHDRTKIDVGARAWGSFTLTDHEGSGATGVVEPEVRIRGNRWRVTAGLLVPFAGELFDQGWISGRLSATVLF
jgi:hypothetical protein